MPFSVVLDACVLYPNALRDTLLRVAEAGVYQPLWSVRILGEVHGVLVRNGWSKKRADYVIECIDGAFPEAMVSGWEGLETTMRNHPKDRHVLAAAVRGHADVIVTANLKDFPAGVLTDFDVEVQHPDTFLCYELEMSPSAVARVVYEQAADTGKHGYQRLTAEDVLGRLETCEVPIFAQQCRQQMVDQ